MKVTMKVEGARELQRGLSLLKGLGARQAVRGALRAASEPIVDAMRARVPRDLGALKEAIGMRIRVFAGRSQGASMRADIGVRKAAPGDYRTTKSGGRQRAGAPAGYGRLIEFGTGQMRPQPFIRPAWDAHGGAKALQRIRVYLAREIRKVAQRQARAVVRLRRKAR